MMMRTSLVTIDHVGKIGSTGVGKWVTISIAMGKIGSTGMGKWVTISIANEMMTRSASY